MMSNDPSPNPRVEAARNYNKCMVPEEKEKENFFTKIVDIVLYPFKQFLNATRIRMDAHVYIEFNLPFVNGSVKFCILTVWIILYMIHNRN